MNMMKRHTMSLNRPAEAFIDHLIRMEINNSAERDSNNDDKKDDYSMVKDKRQKMATVDDVTMVSKTDEGGSGSNGLSKQQINPMAFAWSKQRERNTEEQQQPDNGQTPGGKPGQETNENVSHRNDRIDQQDIAPLNLIVRKDRLQAPTKTQNVLTVTDNKNDDENLSAVPQLSYNLDAIPPEQVKTTTASNASHVENDSILKRRLLSVSEFEEHDNARPTKIGQVEAATELTLEAFILSNFKVTDKAKRLQDTFEGKGLSEQPLLAKPELEEVFIVASGEAEVKNDIKTTKGNNKESICGTDTTQVSKNDLNQVEKSKDNEESKSSELAKDKEHENSHSNDKPFSVDQRMIREAVTEFHRMVEEVMVEGKAIIRSDPANTSGTNASSNNPNDDSDDMMKNTSVSIDEKGTATYHCNRCNVSFPHMTDLQMHTFTHLRKKHRCPACSKEFYNLSSVKRHMIIHTRLKPFKCQQCSRAFNLYTNLRKHFQRMHDATLPIIGRTRVKNPNSSQYTDNNSKRVASWHPDESSQNPPPLPPTLGFKQVIASPRDPSLLVAVSPSMLTTEGQQKSAFQLPSPSPGRYSDTQLDINWQSPLPQQQQIYETRPPNIPTINSVDSLPYNQQFSYQGSSIPSDGNQSRIASFPLTPENDLRMNVSIPNNGFDERGYSINTVSQSSPKPGDEPVRGDGCRCPDCPQSIYARSYNNTFQATALLQSSQKTTLTAFPHDGYPRSKRSPPPAYPFPLSSVLNDHPGATMRWIDMEEQTIPLTASQSGMESAPIKLQNIQPEYSAQSCYYRTSPPANGHSSPSSQFNKMSPGRISPSSRMDIVSRPPYPRLEPFDPSKINLRVLREYHNRQNQGKDTQIRQGGKVLNIQEKLHSTFTSHLTPPNPQPESQHRGLPAKVPGRNEAMILEILRQKLNTESQRNKLADDNAPLDLSRK